MKIDGARYEGGELILSTTDMEARRLPYNFEPGDYQLIRAQKRRSLDANAYAWVLIDKIASVVGLTKTEVYRNAIREIGGVSTTVSVRSDAIESLERSWARQGLGWQVSRIYDDGEYMSVNLIYGSSAYDTAQMSRLIDQLIQDARAVGIETLPPEKLEGMMQAWDEANAQRRSQ